MQTVYRVTREDYAREAFTGVGASLSGGRFNSKRTPVVYTSETLSLAILEKMVHLEDYSTIVDNYMVVRARIDRADIRMLQTPQKIGSSGPSSLSIEGTNIREGITGDWRRYPYPGATQTIGDRWIDEKISLALKVPSAVVPEEYNCLINPEHPRFDPMEILDTYSLSIDPRLAP